MTNAVALAQGASNNVTMRNRIINGAMVIDQRNAGASITPTGGFTYSVDRWQYGADPSNKVSIQQNAGSVTPPAGFTKYLGITSLSAYTSSSSDQINIEQRIEGYNIADLSFGTANARAVTLSFWVYSSLTGSFSGALVNGDYTRSYPFSYTISSANTWTYITVTIAGDTTGTWSTNNSQGIIVYFNLGCGSTYLGTAGAWTGSEKHGVTGSVSMTATNGATFYFTGVQLEAGTTASPFEYRQIGQELNLCQRYYQKTFNQSTAPANNVGTSYLQISLLNGQDPQITFPLPVIMRSAPTVTLYNPFFSSPAGQWSNGSSSSSNARSLNLSDSTMQIDNTDVTLSGWGNAGINYAASAEL
jgi:hypothetical protein